MVLSPKQLPIFEGYTLDFRLRQFRKFDKEKFKMEFIDFDSKKGQILLIRYYKN
jgi:hypothetical protein